MAITQLYTAIAGDVITAARWNNEFGNIYNNLVPLLSNYAAPNLKDDFSAVGDGTTSDQSAVASAVAASYASGQELYWPDGTYLTTATIPNFHDVRHRGPGILKRSSDLFYVDPSMQLAKTNNLYVSTTGSNTADGLSSSESRLTCQSTGNIIYGYTYGDVTWKINFAAGTYSTQCSFTQPFPTPRTTYFLGVVKSNGTVPTTIFDAPSLGVHGLYFQNGMDVRVEDIKFTDYSLTGTPNANALISGLVVDGRCNLYTRNIWADNCDVGISVYTHSQARIEAGKFGATTACGAAVLNIRYSFASIGYGGSVADSSGATGVAVIGGGYGVFSKEWAMTHADYCYFSAQTLAGVILLTSSRVNATASAFVSCNVGIDARSLSNVGATVTTTFTTCTTDIAYRGGSIPVGDSYDATNDISPPTKQISTGGSTQSATPVTVYTKNFAANELQIRGTGFRLRLYCDVTGVANTKTVVVTLGATTLLTAVIAAATLEYEINVDLCQVTAATSQRYFTRIHQSGVLPVYNTGGSAEDMTAAKTLTVTHQVTNVADLNRVNFIECEITH